MNGTPPRRVRGRASLRRRLPLAVALLVALAVALTLLGSLLLLRTEFSDRARHQLAQQMAGAASYYSTKQSDLRGAARLLRDDRAVSTALLRAASGGLRQSERVALILHLQPYYADLNVDRLDLVDTRGRVVVRMDDPFSSGDSLAAHPSIRTALHGREACGVERDAATQDGGAVLRVTLPLYAGSGQLVGAVSVGHQLDSLFASEIGHAVQATVHLRATSALPSGVALPPQPAAGACVFSPLGGTAAGQMTTRQEHGRAVLAGVVPLAGADGGMGGSIEVVQPLSDVYDASNTVTAVLLLVGLAVAALSAGVGIVVSRGLTGRLSALEVTAAAVAEGDLDQQMPIQGTDEIASLARSLGRMVRSLRERVALTAHLRDTAEARVHELEGLAEIAQLLTSAPSLDTTLNDVAARICAIVGCPATAIALLEEDGGPRDGRRLVLRGAQGMQPPTRALLSQIIAATPVSPPDPAAADGAGMHTERAERAESAENAGAAGAARAAGAFPFAFRRALRENTSQWLGVATLPHAPEASDEVTLLHQACLREGWEAATAVPMVLQGQSQGVVICWTAEPRPLPEAEVRVLRTVVGQATVAVENARLYAQSHDLAVLEERTRLARDLHDSVTQSLFSLNLAARAAANARTRAEPARLDRALAMVGDLAQSSLAEMRALLFELRPAQLQGEGLPVALRNHAAAMEQRTGLSVQVDMPDLCALPSRHEDALYRVAQEALANVARHARARQAVVRLRLLPGWVELTIEDDGVGLAPPSGLSAEPASAAGRYGIQGMRERVVGLGGQLNLHNGTATGAGRGTSLTARLPVPGAEPSSADAADAAETAPTHGADAPSAAH